MRDGSAGEIRRRAERAGLRVLLWCLALGAIAWVAAALGSVRSLGEALSSISAPADACAGCRGAGPAAAVFRGRARVARIRQVADPGGDRRLPLYLAPASGPVVDSARAGTLAAWLSPPGQVGGALQLGLVPRDSVAGLPVVAGLVVAPGEPPVPVHGGPAPRP